MCVIQSQWVENILPSQEKPVVIFIQKHSRQVQIAMETTENGGTVCGQQICVKEKEIWIMNDMTMNTTFQLKNDNKSVSSGQSRLTLWGENGDKVQKNDNLLKSRTAGEALVNDGSSLRTKSLFICFSCCLFNLIVLYCRDCSKLQVKILRIARLCQYFL